ncbi:DNA polymerase III subunit gamma/tau [Agarivorans sp. MS3-6]
MNYQALARKWRPKTFQQVVAQQHVLAGLINSLDQQRLHHAYLFSGTRGVGKTTIARLFAKSLNCEQGVSSQPCGKCSNCIEVDQGNFVDLLEIDAASRTKVEDTRELLDNVQYSPAKGRYKVYLIDEVHMLSRHSFNALLKTLEEPPEHVKFLLATTDPQKLPVTVLSRCLQFHLKALNEDQISKQLAHILDAEQRAYQPSALNALAHAADGSMRDALSLTDQALALSNQQLEYQQVLDMLGVLDPHQLRQLLCHVVAGQTESVFSKVSELASLAPDYEYLHQQLAEIIHKVSMAQVLPASQSDETIQMLAEQLDAQLLQLLYQIVITGKRDFAYAPNPRVGFEMTVLRMLAFQPVSAETALVGEPSINASPSNAELEDSSLVKEQQEILEQATQQGYQLQPQPAQTTHETPLVEQDKAERENQREQSIAKLKTQLRADDKQSSPDKRVQSKPIVDAPKVEPHTTPVEAVLPAASIPASSANSEQSITQTSELNEQLPPVDDSYYAQLADRDDEQAEHDPAYSVDYMPLDVESASAPAASVAPEQATPIEDTASLLQLRSQLRGRGKSEKKSEGAQASLNIDRLATSTSQANIADGVGHSIEEPLQAAEKPSFQAQASDENERWAEMVNYMELGPIARQIAINSLYSFDGTNVGLLLKPDLSHLPKPSSLTELKQQLSVCLKTEVELRIEVGEDLAQKTPLELQQLLHIKNTEAAVQRLLGDQNIQILQQQFGAELDKESVKYH